MGVREYEWIPLWLGLFDRNPGSARAFLYAYDSSLFDDHEFLMRAIAWTLLHDFGADELIRLRRERGQLKLVRSIEELRGTSPVRPSRCSTDLDQVSVFEVHDRSLGWSCLVVIVRLLTHRLLAEVRR